MKFKINNEEWEIKEITQEEIRKDYLSHYCKIDDNGRYHGVTWCDTHQIFIDKDLCIDEKKHTLLHELTHCFIYSYIKHYDKGYEEEEVCDIVANSNNIINDIYIKYRCECVMNK